MRKILALLVLVGLLAFRTDALESDNTLNELQGGELELQEQDVIKK